MLLRILNLSCTFQNSRELVNDEDRRGQLTTKFNLENIVYVGTMIKDLSQINV